MNINSSKWIPKRTHALPPATHAFAVEVANSSDDPKHYTITTATIPPFGECQAIFDSFSDISFVITSQIPLTPQDPAFQGYRRILLTTADRTLQPKLYEIYRLHVAIPPKFELRFDFHHMTHGPATNIALILGNDFMHACNLQVQIVEKDSP